MPDNTPRRRRPPNDATSDIERFLAEVDRLRRKAATDTRRADERGMDEVQEVLPVEPVRPRPAPPPPPSRPRSRPRPRQVDEVEVVDVAPGMPVAQLTNQADNFVQATQARQAAAAPTAPAAVRAVKGVKEAGAITSRAVNPTAVRMLNLLRSNDLRAVFMLREVFEPPLSKRRRR